MVQRFRETGHLVFISISALSRGILKQEKGTTSIHFNGDSILVFREQWRIGVINSGRKGTSQ